MKSEKKDFVVNLILTTIFTVIYVLLLEKYIQVKYYTNDQLIMHDIASGVYTGKNDGHLIYIMYILGSFLAGLYKLIPNVQWYDWLMALTYPVSSALFSVKICSFMNKIWKKMISLGVFLVAFFVTNMYGCVLNEYTLDAAIWASLGLFYLLTSRHDFKWKVAFEEAVVVISLLLCLWLRRQVFFMAIPFVVLIAIYCVFSKKDSGDKENGSKRFFFKGDIIVALRPIFFVIIGVVISFLVEKIAYSSLEWQDYFAYNQARTDIFDYAGVPTFAEHQDLYESLGISEGEVDAMWHGFSMIRKLDTSAMQSIAKVSKTLNDGKVAADKSGFVYSVRRELYDAKRQPIGMLVAILTIAAYGYIFLAMFVNFGKRKALFGNRLSRVLRLLFPFFLGGYVISFLVLFLFLGRYPFRVSQGMYTMAFFVALGFLLLEGKRFFDVAPKQIWGNIFYLVTCFLLVLFSIKAFDTNRDLVARTNAEWGRYNSELALLENYCIAHPENIYSFDYSISNYQNDILLNHSFETAPNSITLNYWITNSPIFFDRLKNVSIDNLTEAFLDYDNVYYFSRPEADDSWLVGLCQCYGINTSLVEVDRLQSSLSDIIVYKVSH